MSDESDIAPEQVSTKDALNAIAYERAPRYDGRNINLRVACADGFKVSIQASEWHYSQDSAGRSRYFDDAGFTYPFIKFEIGAPSDEIEDIGVWPDCESGGVWAYVPRWAVEELLVRHGGVTHWEQPAERKADRV